MICKPGDLVVCIGGARQEFIGRIFTVTTRCDVYADSWDTDPPLYVSGNRHPVSFADYTLRPIRNDPGADQTIEWAGKPTETPANQQPATAAAVHPHEALGTNEQERA